MDGPNFHVLLIIKTVKTAKFFSIWRDMALHMYDGWFPLQLEEYFYCHSVFLYEIGWDPFRQQQERDFSRHKGWENRKSAEKFWYGRKNSNLVGKKGRGGVHAGKLCELK